MGSVPRERETLVAPSSGAVPARLVEPQGAKARDAARVLVRRNWSPRALQVVVGRASYGPAAVDLSAGRALVTANGRAVWSTVYQVTPDCETEVSQLDKDRFREASSVAGMKATRRPRTRGESDIAPTPR